MNEDLEITVINEVDDLDNLRGISIQLGGALLQKIEDANRQLKNPLKKIKIFGAYSGCTDCEIDYNKVNDMIRKLNQNKKKKLKELEDMEKLEWIEYEISFFKSPQYKIIIRKGNYGDRPMIEIVTKKFSHWRKKSK